VTLAGCSSPQRPTAQPAEGAGAARYYLAEADEQAPGPCTACGPITLVRLADRGPGPVDQAYIDDLGRQLRATYGLDVKVAPAVTLPPAAFDAQRRQWDGKPLLEQLEQAFPKPATDGSTVIGLMNEDIFLGFKPEWRWAFGGRTTFDAGGGWAVISAHRMAGPAAPRRMMVMLGKYIGGIACGFEETTDRSSIMYNNVLSAKDLDGMNAVACSLD
jgi:hypothetical protein